MRPRIILAFGLLLAFAEAGAAQDKTITPLRDDLGQRTFETACSACHYRGADKLPFDADGPPAAESSDELVRFILFGKAPEDDEGQMPGFAAGLTDADVTRLVLWLRSAAKPDAPWSDVASTVAQMRSAGRRGE